MEEKRIIDDNFHVDVCKVRPGNKKVDIYGRIERPSSEFLMPPKITECYHLIYNTLSGKFLKEEKVFTETLVPSIWPFGNYWDTVKKIREDD